jgi:hypothetical protein
MLQNWTKLSFLLISLSLLQLDGWCAALNKVNATPSRGSVYYDAKNQTFYFKANVVDPQNGVAWGEMYPESNVTGWDRLYIHTSVTHPDERQSFAAGYLEGILTYQQIISYSLNLGSGRNNEIKSALIEWCTQQYNWLLSQIKLNVPKDPYWRNVNFIRLQFEGLYQGFHTINQQHPNDPKLTMMEIYLLASWTDLSDIANSLNITSVPDISRVTVEEIDRYLFRRGRCSSLVKVTGDLSALFSGHTTWSGYSTMNRMLKVYDMPLRDPSVVSVKVSLSSYPATLDSADDWYITDTGLVVMETTNDVLNRSLFQYVTQHSLLSWMRAILANRMALSGKTWTSIFAQYNSGTYNNQWMIVDYKLFEPKKPLKAGTLWILEQIPGYTQAADVTEYLSFGYWPSYNIPFFHEISERSGWNILARNNTKYNYATAPRANIFRRDQATVTTLEAMKRIMRYNDWQHDPYSLGSPVNQISARGDLKQHESQADCMGGIDSKIVDHSLIQHLVFVAQGGPTHDQLPPFVWSNSPCRDQLHYGMPNVWNFNWFYFRPNV